MFKEQNAIALGYKSQLLDEVVPFWEDRVLDKEYGGYFIYFTRDGTLYDTLKPGWFVGRIMHTFAALYNEIDKKEKWLKIAEAGRKMFDTSFYAGDGRFNMMLDQKGKVLEGTTSIFTDHFAVKGLYEYIHAKDLKEDIPLAEELSDFLFSNVKKQTGLQKLAVTFMTLITAQESRKVLGSKYQPVVDECIKRSLYEFANDRYQAFFEYIDNDGQPALDGPGRVLDPGHTMEALWFAMSEGGGYHQRAGQILDWVIERAYDEEYGGFYHLVDIDGKEPKGNLGTVDYGPVKAKWNDKIWWVQCEALVALAMSAVLNKNERHWKYFLKQREFTESLFRDRTYGEWYAFLKPDGGMLCDLKGFAGKGPYHVPRCLMRLAQFL